MNRISITALTTGLSTLLFLCASPTLMETRAQDQDFEGFYLGGNDDEVAPFRTQGNGWTFTSSGGSSLGQPATVTWSVVPDNTQLPTGLGEPVSNSDLISFLDGIHHGGNSPGGADLTQRTWWGLMNSVFERWDELSGVDFNYEDDDDGAKLGTASGVLNTRGDHRIGGHSIDGQTSPTFLAYNFFPNNSDMVIDTDEINRWSNSSNNYRLFRNMMMHEVGHGIGLNHVESFDVNPDKPKFQFGTFLMEPILSGAFDGPQFDDILGAHRLYGDVYEESGGNETYQTATMLGSLQAGQTISIGTDADDTYVSPSDTDFVSIDDESDTDYFKFSIASPQVIDLILTPMGPTYDEGPGGSGNNGTQQSFDSSAKNNLTLSLYNTNGTSLLGSANAVGAGQIEEISEALLSTPGDYYVRVAGISFNKTQFFQLDIKSVPEPSTWCLASSALAGLFCRRRRTA